MRLRRVRRPAVGFAISRSPRLRAAGANSLPHGRFRVLTLPKIKDVERIAKSPLQLARCEKKVWVFRSPETLMTLHECFVNQNAARRESRDQMRP